VGGVVRIDGAVLDLDYWRWWAGFMIVVFWHVMSGIKRAVGWGNGQKDLFSIVMVITCGI